MESSYDSDDEGGVIFIGPVRRSRLDVCHLTGFVAGNYAGVGGEEGFGGEV